MLNTHVAHSQNYSIWIAKYLSVGARETLSNIYYGTLETIFVKIYIIDLTQSP